MAGLGVFDWGGVVTGLIQAGSSVGGSLIAANSAQNTADTQRKIEEMQLATENRRIAADAAMAAALKNNSPPKPMEQEKQSGLTISPSGLALGLGAVLVVGLVVTVVVVSKKKPAPEPQSRRR